jgi:hypothetical protein
MAIAEEPAAEPGKTRARAAGQARAGLAGLLVLVVFAGLRAASPAVIVAGPWQHHLAGVCGLAEAALAVLLTATQLISRRRPDPAYPAYLLRRGLRRTIIIFMIAGAALVVFSRVTTHPLVTPPPPPKLKKLSTPTPTPLPRQGSNAADGPDLTHLIYALLAVLLAAALIACVIVILRQRALASPAAYLDEAEDETESLRRAVESGRTALRTLDDAQAAIIACYVAMETSLSEAGTPRAAAETPDELLARAGRTGLLHGGAAAQLTALFYEARFSSHALPPAARDQASQALAAISADLARRNQDAPGSPAPSGPRP